MPKSSILERNMLALSNRDPSLSAEIGAAHEHDSIKILKSKNGLPVPALLQNGTLRYLHSRIDPQREGNRYFEHKQSGGFLLFFGFAGGYHILPFLERTDISGILIVEESFSYMKSILSAFELSRLILDPRVSWIVDGNEYDLEKRLLEEYLPAVCGDLHMLALQSRINSSSGYFQRLAKVVHYSIEQFSADYSVQSYFGKRWFANSIKNLPASQWAISLIPPARKAKITGAGPSLESSLPQLAKREANEILIATDTSLPVLLQHDIEPDIVISIDCQHITYHHFLQGYPRHIPLVLDLASPVFLSRISDKPFFFTSGHPFSQYINANWRCFPFIDTSGGNVSHAAVSLAYHLGVEEVELYGADFSYPRGKSYARGSYLYPYFHSRSKRLNPSETSFLRFIFENESLSQEQSTNYIRYNTRPMLSYRNRLSELSRSLNLRIIHHQGEGLSIDSREDTDNHNDNDEHIAARLFSAGSSRGDWKQFLSSYRSDLAALPKADLSFSAYLSSLKQEQKSLCLTLFPACAAIRREEIHASRDIAGARIINAAKAWSISLIDSYLLKLPSSLEKTSEA